MAVFDLIQQKSAGSVGDQSSLNVVLDSAPQVGNTLIARIATRDQNTDLARPAGFRPATFQLGNVSSLIFYRHVQSGDSQTITATQGAASDVAMHVEEIEGVLVPHRSATSTPQTNVTSKTSGTTAATTTAAAICVATVGMLRGDSINHAWTNGYALRVFQAGSVTGTTGIGLVAGDLVVAATGTQESTCSWSGSARACGAIAVFREGTLQSDGPYATAVKADSPARYYRLAEEDAAGACVDEMGNAHLKYSTGNTMRQAGPIVSEPSYAVQFDGTNGTGASLGQPGDDYPQYLGDGTIELWVNVTNPATGIRPAWLSYDVDVHGTVAFPTADGGSIGGTPWITHYRDNTVTGRNYEMGVPVTNGQWEVFWATFDATGLHVYGPTGGVVGELGSGATDITRLAILDTRIGASQLGVVNYGGLVAEVAIYQAVLTTTQMQDHYDAATATDDPANLQASVAGDDVTLIWDV